jgi:signal transduction histidine kinase
MSSHRSRADRHRSVAVELALFYALFFGLVSAAAGTLLYQLVRTHIVGEIEQDITRHATELRRTLVDEGVEALGHALSATVDAGGTDDYVVRLLNADGGVILSSDASAWPPLPAPPPAGTWADQRFRSVILPDMRGSARILTVAAGEGRYLQLGNSLGESEVFLDHLERYGLIVLGTMLTLGSIVGWALARRAMGGVESVTRAAQRIADGHFSDRVEAAGHGREIDDLVVTFNRMAERVQTVMQEMRHVNDSIAHDLRSPLTRIRGLAEAAVMDRTLCGEGAELAGSIVEECDRLMQLVNTVLDIAETEAGVRGLRLEEVDLGALAAQATELFAGVAEDKGITLTSRTARGQVVSGDRRRLQRALANLVDNALKYTPPGGRVIVTVSGADRRAEIAVNDSGPGIAAADLPPIFDRFYRGDRARKLPGNGLGLALALAVARAHGGEVAVQTGSGGSTFTLRLPTAT